MTQSDKPPSSIPIFTVPGDDHTYRCMPSELSTFLVIVGGAPMLTVLQMSDHGRMASSPAVYGYCMSRATRSKSTSHMSQRSLSHLHVDTKPVSGT